MVYKFK